MVQLSMFKDKEKSSNEGALMMSYKEVNLVLLSMVGMYLYGIFAEVISVVTNGDGALPIGKVLLIAIAYSSTVLFLFMVDKGKNIRLYGALAYLAMTFLLTHSLVGLYFALLISILVAAFVYVRKQDTKFVTSALIAYWILMILVSVLKHDLLSSMQLGLGQTILEAWSIIWTIGTKEVFDSAMVGLGLISILTFGFLSNRNNKETEETKKSSIKSIGKKSQTIEEIREQNRKVLDKKVQNQVKERMTPPNLRNEDGNGKKENNEKSTESSVDTHKVDERDKKSNVNEKKSKKFFNIKKPTLNKKVSIAKETILRKLSK